MQVRRASADDAEAIAAIYLSSRDAAGAAFPPGLHPPSEVLEHVRDVQIGRRETWLVGAPDEPAGFLVLDGDEIDWLFVAPEHQGQGVGSSLLDLARRERPDGLALWVFVSNDAARGFYERHGFRLVRTTDGAANEEKAPDMRYVWGDHPEGRTPAPSPS
ncbi:Acetyltransferase (GNAT) family protein [Frankineae bacterium MT45]|nr:Acetyltransferase (GNAT) family protein [Frankineae bacterium MT45]